MFFSGAPLKNSKPKTVTSQRLQLGASWMQMHKGTMHPTPCICHYTCLKTDSFICKVTIIFVMCVI